MNTNKIPIVYYHSVAPAKHPSWFKKYLTLELKYFEEHLKYFTKNGYKFLLLKDVFEAPGGVISNPPEASEKSFGATKSKIPHPDKVGIRNDNQVLDDNRVWNDNRGRDRKLVCLTFDDGYLDNFIYVYPLLKKYLAKATIFISPTFVDKRSIIRKTLEDYSNNKATLKEIDQWGFLSWDEMRLMEQSGIVDIQSHTLTHSKYFVSDKLVGFHHPGADCVYAVGNLYPDRLPYYIEDQEFEKLIPYGYPFFEQESSITAKKATINPSFTHSVIQTFKDLHWSQAYDFRKLFNKIKPIYEDAISSNSIIISVESEEDYKKRVYYELKMSKELIEKELNKQVDFCCWPHGDNDEFTHKAALEIGYKATTIGKANVSPEDQTRFNRFGLGQTADSMFLTKIKTNYKVKSFQKIQPYFGIKNIYEFFRDLG